MCLQEEKAVFMLFTELQGGRQTSDAQLHGVLLLVTVVTREDLWFCDIYFVKSLITKVFQNESILITNNS